MGKDKNLKIEGIKGEIVGNFTFIKGTYCKERKEQYTTYDYVLDANNNEKKVVGNYIDNLCLQLYNCIDGLLYLPKIYNESINDIPKTWLSSKKKDWRTALDLFKQSVDFSLTITFCTIARELLTSFQKICQYQICYKEYDAEKQNVLDKKIWQTYNCFKPLINKTIFLKFVLTDEDSQGSYSYVIHRFNPEHTNKKYQESFERWKSNFDKLLSQINISKVKDELNYLVSLLNHIDRKLKFSASPIWPNMDGWCFLKYDQCEIFSVLNFLKGWRMLERFQRDENKRAKLNKGQKIVLKHFHIFKQFNDKEYTHLRLSLSFNDWEIKKYQTKYSELTDDNGLLYLEDSSWLGTYKKTYKVIGEYDKWLSIMKDFREQINHISDCRNRQIIEQTLIDFLKANSKSLVLLE